MKKSIQTKQGKTTINSIKILFSLIAILFSQLSFSQTENAFYKTYDDYLNDKPIAGVKPVDDSWAMVMSIESIKVTENGKQKKLAVKDLPGVLFIMNNKFYRACKGKIYWVLASGPICYYASQVDNGLQKYSETITGELNQFSESWLTGLLEKNGLLDAYKKDKPKREFKDNVNGYFNKVIARYIKYIQLLNEKLK